MNYRLKIALFLSALLVGCNQPTQFTKDNINDPSSSNFNPDSVSNIELIINNNFAELRWDIESKFVEGFQIFKANNSDEVFFDTTNNSDKTSIQDNTLSPFDGYYQINQITKNDTVVQSGSRITYKYQVSEFTNSFDKTNGSVQLSWNYNGYFDTNFVLERSNDYSGDELKFELQNSYQLIDDNFNENNVGLNTYELYPESSIATGDTLVTEIRLPQWLNLQNLPIEIDQAHLVMIDSSIYAIRASSQNYRYDPYLNNWYNISDNNSKFDRERFRIEALTNNEILVLNRESYEIYDINNDNWSYFYDVPYPNVQGLAVEKIDDRYVLLTGGDIQASSPLEPTKNSYLFDITNKSWTQVSDMNFTRAYHSLLRIQNGEAIAFGGFTNFRKVEHFILSQNEWINLPDSPINIREAVLLTNGDLIVVSENASSVYDFDSQNWSNPVGFDKDQFAFDKYNDMTLTALPNGNAILTGLTGQERAIASQIYDTSLEKWIQIGNTTDPRMRSWNFVINGEKILSIGGAHFDSGYTYETINLGNYLEE